MNARSSLKLANWLHAITLGLLVMLITAPTSSGQNGQPAIATSSTTWSTSPAGTYLDAYVFSSSGNMCARISAAWASLTGTMNSTIIDARGFTGTQACAGSSPFPSVAHGKLLLGNVTITTTATWVVPAGVTVEGLGTAGPPGFSPTGVNTTIKAVTGFPTTGVPVIQMGSGGSQYGIKLKGLTIDCHNLANCIGLYNNTAQEGSVAEDIVVNDAPAFGVLIDSACLSPCSGGAGAVNSGPYRNITVQYTSCGHCGGSTIGLEVLGQLVVRDFDNITVAGNGLFTGAAGIQIQATTALTNSHVEAFPIGINIAGGATVTRDVVVQNVSIGSNMSGWDIQIGGSSDVVLMAIRDQSANGQILNDTVTSHTVTSGNSLGFYMLGIGGTVASSDSSISWDIPGGIVKHGGWFKIDDPQDPANKYLYHSFVESPDMMNIYNGLATTNNHGIATVTLPKYFESLNQDFRYQLTTVGQAAEAFVADKIKNNQFVIKTNKPSVEVSWQVTGVRHDAWANAHRIGPEVDKPLAEQGHYLYADDSETQSKKTAVAPVLPK